MTGQDAIPSAGSHLERPEDRWQPRRPAAQPVIVGDRLIADDGTVIGRFTRLHRDLPVRWHSGPAGTAAAAPRGGTRLIYGNTLGTWMLAPSAGALVADDLRTDSDGRCAATAYEVLVAGGGDGTGPGFSVTTALYDACPGDGGQILPGSQATTELPDDGLWMVTVDLTASEVPIPVTAWLGMTFSTNTAGWILGAPAEIGSTEDRYHLQFTPCYATFGGTGIWAGFHARVWAASECHPFPSIQVNVDEAGANIPGDAANEPSIAIDPTDPSKMAIGFRQFDNVSSNFRQAGWGYSRDGGKSWTFPGVIEPGVFRSDPVLGFDAEGRFYFYSLTDSYTCDIFRSFDGGATWDAGTFAFGGDKAWMTIDRTNGIGHGNIYSAWSWLYGCCGFSVFSRSVDGGDTFSTPIAIPEPPLWGTLAVGPDGTLYVCGIGSDGQPVVARSSNAQDPSAVPVFDHTSTVYLGGTMGSNFASSPNPGGLLGQMWIAADHSNGPTRGNVYLLASVTPGGSDNLDVKFVRSTDRGETWSAAIRVNDDPPSATSWQWFGTMSVAPNGRIDAVWNDTRNTGNERLSEVYYSFSLDAGATWAPNVSKSPVFDSHVGWPNQNKIGDYYDMISYDDSAYLAYAATFNSEQDVYFMRIEVDCNGNGIPDTEDIENGTSEDCNANGTPDECEPDEDCDGNGVQDICDIANGTQQDCNGNLVPDVCEPDEDCNGNGVQDICDIAAGVSADCNDNSVPDECDIAGGTADDCNTNGIPDDCDILVGNGADCNSNGALDECDIASGTADDCNNNVIPDECELPDCGLPSGGCPGDGGCCAPSGNGSPGCTCANCCVAVCATYPYCCSVAWDSYCAFLAGNQAACSCALLANDCNVNGLLDECEIADGTADDCNGNLTPDECEPDEDCNGNQVQDICDVAAGTSQDCNANQIPDECEPDDDCNANGVQDFCDLASGSSEDCDVNGVPDECQPDCNGNGIADACDILGATSSDCNANEVPDECDIESGTSGDCNANDVPDECDVVGCGEPTGPCPGQGDCCAPDGNGTPGCDCANCCAVICEVDPFCCNYEWDYICAMQAVETPVCRCGVDTPPSEDCNANDVPDECEPDEDCNGNGTRDICDIGAGTSADCDQNLVPDECDVDCNQNGTPDACDLAGGTSPDCDANGVPDECQVDSDGDTVPDECDVCPAGDDRIDTDTDGQPDECDPCPLDNPDDTDGDGVCDSADVCPGADDAADADGDTVPDCLDQCPGLDDRVDVNENGTPDCLEAEPVPTTTAWGMFVLALLLLCGAKVALGQRWLRCPT